MTYVRLIGTLISVNYQRKLEKWNDVPPQSQTTKASIQMDHARRKALVKKQELEDIVTGLERKLDIDVTWTEECDEWRVVMTYVATRKYQKALSHLEGLVVSRLFELSKLNMSGLGAYL